MNDERSAVATITDAILQRWLGPTWQRLTPLSAGAVASAVVIVGSGTLLKRLLGSRRARALGWIGSVALVSAALWLLSETEAKETLQPAAGADGGSGDGGEETTEG
ncbi:MAG: hypothetical protein AMS25_04920 [Gemmatimonas sp. SM23_52]|nr:MAG: hypothetical protein AMS25_04920 [Gemmatimonas sp. SM23_52]